MCSMANGKRYDNAVQTFDREANFAPNEAVAMSKKLATAKFDETIELVCRLVSTRARQKRWYEERLPSHPGPDEMCV